MSERAVHVAVQLRQVRMEAEGREISLSYPGILLTGFEDGQQVGERWVPFGEDPSEQDDERLIEALHRALVWQQNDALGC